MQISTTTSAPPAQRVALEQFDDLFGSLIELSSEALGGKITAVSDEFFAKAECLLRVAPSVSMKGQFGPNGALFDGWESRRHNPKYDWTIIKLGALGSIVGCDIDTGHFSGNESPASGVWGANVPEGETVNEDSPLWTPLLPITPLGPAQRHLFLLPAPSAPYTHLKLTMHPDGGLGRFRAYGHVVPPPAPAPSSRNGEAIDLAYVLNGGTVTGESDQHFGRGGNLILPGRGKDMGDGWETKRSRGRLGTGKGDWVVVKLAEPGYLEWADIDTLHFVGNFPESAELYGIVSDEKLPAYEDAGWTRILERTKLGPHRQHFYQLAHPDRAWTHVRLDIFPDGGVKRLRLYGRPASQYPNYSSLVSLPCPAPASASTSGSTPTSASAPVTSLSLNKSVPKLPALPLTPSAFAPYGFVLQSYPDARSAPKEIPIKRVNFGTADKFNFLADCRFVGEGEARINMCVFRCEAQNGEKVAGAGEGAGTERWEVKVLERHEFSSQAFVPMGAGGGRYLVLVALPGPDGTPSLPTLRAFIATSSQGICYHPNVWHHPLIALGDAPATDFACVVYETGVAEVDCEIRWFEEGTVAVVEAVSG